MAIQNQKLYQELFFRSSCGYAFFRALFDADGDPARLMFHDANEAFFRLSGLTREQLMQDEVALRAVFPDSLTAKSWPDAFYEIAKNGGTREYPNTAQVRPFTLSIFCVQKGIVVVQLNQAAVQAPAQYMPPVEDIKPEQPQVVNTPVILQPVQSVEVYTEIPVSAPTPTQKTVPATQMPVLQAPVLEIPTPVAPVLQAPVIEEPVAVPPVVQEPEVPVALVPEPQPAVEMPVVEPAPQPSGFRQLLEASYDWAIELDEHYLIRHNSTPSGALPFNASQAEEGSNFLALLDADLSAQFIGLMGKVTTEGKMHFIDYAAPQGKWYMIFAAPQQAGYGHGSIVCIKDITSLRTEREAPSNDTMLGGLLSVALDLLCVFSDEGRVLIVNGACTDILGYSTEEYEAQNQFDLIHPEDLSAMTKALHSIENTDQAVVIKNRCLHQKGNYRDVEWKVTHRGSYFFASGRDITDQLQREEEIRRNNDRLETVASIMLTRFVSLPALLDYSLEQAIRLTGSKLGYIYSYDEENAALSMLALSKDLRENPPHDVYPLADTGLWGEVVRKKKPLLLNDIEEQHQNSFPVRDISVRHFLSMPLISDDRLVGVIGLANKDTEYELADLLQLNFLMNTVWRRVERERSIDELETEKMRLGVTLESIADAVIATDEHGRVTMMNSLAIELTGYTKEEAAELDISKVFAIVLKDEQEPSASPVREVLHTGEAISCSHYCYLMSKDGNKTAVSYSAAPIRLEYGSILGAILVFRDMTQKQEREAEIEYLSYHDTLTGLYNRAYCEQALSRMDDAQFLPLAIIMGDVNGLKLTNDILGHFEGDRLLQAIARILAGRVGDEGVVARWGGDEFVMLLPNASEELAKTICEGIIKDCAENTEIPNLTISLGYALKKHANENLAGILKNAEDYMYKRKYLESTGVRSSVITSIRNTLFEKSHETEEHAARLCELCNEVGVRLGLSETELNELQLFALLHDIGKIAVNETIVSKPSSLNEEEISEMRKHPEIGYRIAKSIPDLAKIAEYILTHHEKWDGSGYPQKLKGASIPLPSRILSVVDSYDAMTNDRPYRKALPPAQAESELIKNAGTQFDPVIVRIFIQVVKEKRRAARVKA